MQTRAKLIQGVAHDDDDDDDDDDVYFCVLGVWIGTCGLAW